MSSSGTVTTSPIEGTLLRSGCGYFGSRSVYACVSSLLGELGGDGTKGSVYVGEIRGREKSVHFIQVAGAVKFSYINMYKHPSKGQYVHLQFNRSFDNC